LTYTSGLITTQESFAQLYGFFEMRAKSPAGRGFWPAFWLLPTDMTWPPEIDVLEVHGQAPDTIYTNVHSKSGGGNFKPHAVGVDTSRGFHTYAVSWRPDEIRWYFDGCEIARTATPADARKPMYIVACLAVGGPGSWPGPADGASSATWAIDYIRAYQFKDLAALRG
jgi:beta-glucanase (GH16 family)